MAKDPTFEEIRDKGLDLGQIKIEQPLKTPSGDFLYNLGDAYRTTTELGLFQELRDNPQARAEAFVKQYQAEGKEPGVQINPNDIPLQGDVAELAEKFGVGQNTIINLRRQRGGGISGESGVAGDMENESFAERTALPATGTPVGTATSYWDQKRGVQIYAAPGQYFNLFSNGAVRPAAGTPPAGSTGAPASSLFTQGKTADGAVAGFKEEQLGYEPIAGKTIKQTGQSVYNPKTKVDEYANPGETLILYTDGTVERRKIGGTPGQATAIDQFGRTPEELGLNPDGSQKSTSAKQKVADYADLEYIGATYKAANGQTRTAKAGNAFYQDPATRTILERPDKGQAASLESKSPSILAARKQAAGTPTNPIDAINAKANAAQKSEAMRIASIAGKGDISDANIQRKIIEGLQAPVAPDMTKVLADQLEATGYNEAQKELSSVKAQIRQLDADWATNNAEQNTRKTSQFQINRRLGAQQMEYDAKRRDLVAEQNALADTVNGQISTVQMLMSATGQNVQNAQVQYQNEITKAKTMYDMIRQDAQDVESSQQKAIDNARANLTVWTNALMSGNIKYSDLDASQKASLNQMEMQVGMPVGFTSFVSEAVKDPVVTIGGMITDKSGKMTTPVYTVDPKTGALKTTYVTQPGRAHVPSSGGSGSSDTKTQQKKLDEFYSDAAGWIEKLDSKDFEKKVDWRTAWDSLHTRYPEASVEMIDTALGIQRRNN